MKVREDKSKIGQLLERLQEESWQLELLVSGFAIFLVAQSWEPLNELLQDISMKRRGMSNDNALTPVFMVTLVGMWGFFLTNLILHVFLRGLWISAIGLRYVSQGIDLSNLNYAPRFKNYLEKTLPDFDDYIERIEKICSIVFGFTFLLVFMLISGMLVFIFFFGVVQFLKFGLEPIASSGVSRAIRIGILIILVLALLLYFIDFITLGFIKKWKWFSRIYYPIYRFYGWITLSFLYRPLFYNLIDNRFGKRVGYFLFPYMLLLITIATIKIDSFLYYPESPGKMEVNRSNYLENYEDGDIISKSVINGKLVKEDYLELFIPYHGRDDDALIEVCPDLKADKTVGTKQTIIQITGDKKGTAPDSVLMCFEKIIDIKINGQERLEKEYYFYRHPNRGEHGILTMIPIDTLKPGQHNITIYKKRMNSQDSIISREIDFIRFWKTKKQYE